jgi:branched-chain amino acid transport system substrate-binding protein
MAIALASALMLLVGACGSATPSSSAKGGNKTLKIGLLGILSGPAASAAAFTNALAAYFNYVNSTGGIDGYKFSYVTRDSAGSSAQAISASEQMVQGDHVAMVAGIGTTPSLGVETIAARLKVPLLLGGDGELFTEPKISPAKSNVFDVNPDQVSEFEEEYKLSRQLDNNQPVGVIQETDATGADAVGIAPYARANHLPQPALTVQAALTSTDCTPYMANMKSAGAKAVMFAGTPALFACMIKAAEGLSYNPVWVGGFGDAGTSFESLIGEATYDQTYLLGYEYPASDTKNAQVQLYLKGMRKFDSKDLTSSFGEQGWDYGTTIAAAVKLAAAKGPVTSASLLKAFQTGFHGQPVGLTGSLLFNSKEHYGVNSMAEMKGSGAGSVTVMGGFQKLPQPYAHA